MVAVVSGSQQLAELAVRIKAAGDRDIRVALLRGLKAGAAPLADAVAEAARDQLPRRGGLNAQVAGQKVTVSVRTGARTAGVRLTTKAPDTAQTDSGYVKHPVFGDRKKWVKQEIPGAKGWWSDTLEKRSPEVAPHLLAVMEAVSVIVQGRL